MTNKLEKYSVNRTLEIMSEVEDLFQKYSVINECQNDLLIKDDDFMHLARMIISSIHGSPYAIFFHKQMDEIFDIIEGKTND